MTEDKGILIHNIYYMLSYAFQELKKNNYEDIDKEDFHRIQDLFAEILYKGIAYQLKQGLYREYVTRNDTLPLLKGKLDIQGTLQNKAQRRNAISCEYDELSENNKFNQILKTTAAILLQGENVDMKRRRQLKSLAPFFDGVDTIQPNLIRWDQLRFQKNNQTYKMLMNICYFILDGMLMTTQSGSYKMATFSDENMNRLFEKFVLQFYRTEDNGISATAERIEWNIDNEKSRVIEFLPSMKTDIVLRKGGKTLVIDTKYYSKPTQEHHGRQSIHSDNLYQIFSYVKNLDKENTGNVSGILLYAQTENHIIPDLDAVFGGNRILAKVLNLNVEFKEIKKQLNSLLRHCD